ncbi:MAG TPA: DsrE family protein [Vicinamibacterales bacterium]|nr:DsrE family protein [Vicinamibacterales bacterium]
MNRRTMMTTLAGGVVAAGYAGRADAAAPAPADATLPVASANAAKDFAGAKELPDPNTDYKVVFSVSAKAKEDEVHPTLKMIGLYLNTLAHNGVPAKNRHIAAMFHQGGGDAVFSNEVYKARHGVDNPNIAALKELHDAGVTLHVCGQGLIGKKVDPSQLLPGVQADLWAMVTMVNLQSRGYVRVG